MSGVDDINHVIGIDDTYIDYGSLPVPVHREIVKPFLQLQAKANDQGFALAIVSGYRSFERQLLIWNEKAQGKRPVLDDDGETVDLLSLSEWQRVQAILRWSALPGTSRHHWGTDIDVYDKSAVAPEYRVQLTAAEVADDGPFGPMHRWLDQQIAGHCAEGFFRPYADDRGGVAPERWHLSHGPVADALQSQLTMAALQTLLMHQPLLLKDAVLSNIEEIFERYIQVPSWH